MKEKNTIPLTTAKKWAKEWRDTEATYNKYNECRAFNIPLDDLKEVIKEDGVHSIRAYIGVEKTQVKGGKPTFEEKLMIVGVNGDGKDMISSSDGEVLDPTSGFIFDFSRPCPSLCDFESPLNG